MSDRERKLWAQGVEQARLVAACFGGGGDPSHDTRGSEDVDMMPDDPVGYEPEPRYPGCVVKLVGEDGNAMAILARVRIALKRHLVREHHYTTTRAGGELEIFTKEAMSGNYDHLLETVTRWVTVE
jgi:hypothetical protein